MRCPTFCCYTIRMNHALLDLVRCPACRGSNLEVAGNPSRQLTCPKCDAVVPIVAGIPRLAGQTESYAASFGRQWNRYDVARDEEDESTFTVKTGILPRDLAGKLVLDAGCGGGRYARLVGSHGAARHRRGSELGGRESGTALRIPTRRLGSPGRSPQPAACGGSF